MPSRPAVCLIEADAATVVSRLDRIWDASLEAVGFGFGQRAAMTDPQPRHVPVLCAEVLSGLAPRANGLYVDATFGAGGYSRAILAVDETRLVALDRDPQAVRDGATLVAASAGRLALHEGRFGELATLVDAPADGVVFDVGVSSMQLDEAARGFSFRLDGPLDMRMGQQGPTAADLVNHTDETTLADILFHFGEERASRRIARAIVSDRAVVPFAGTRALAELVARVAPTKSDIHPATRTFQALRIAVNEELVELVRGLEAAEAVLRPGGRLAVVTFHSLEDRIVKQFLAARSGRGTTASRHLPGDPDQPAPTFTLIGRQPIVPSEAEARINPRARSAKLRVAARTAEPPRGMPPAVRSLAELPPRRPGRR